jgi:hypothetical protein
MQHASTPLRKIVFIFYFSTSESVSLFISASLLPRIWLKEDLLSVIVYTLSWWIKNHGNETKLIRMLFVVGIRRLSRDNDAKMVAYA